MSESSKARPKILHLIHTDLINGKLHIPVLPEIALKIRDNAKADTTEFRHLASLVQADTALSTYLFRVANSTFFARLIKAKTPAQAISRLGFNKTCALSLSYSLKSLFSANDYRHRKLLEAQWRRSTYVAALSAVLARHCRDVDEDRVLLAALLQDIGALPVIQKAADYLSNLGTEEELVEVLEHYGNLIGVHILEKWGFDEDLIEVVRTREQWERTHTGEADISDVILVARLHSYIGSPKMSQLPRINTIPAFQKLNLRSDGELTVNCSLKILDEAKDEVLDLQNSLL